MKVEATVHGAVSIVNAIATGKGATLGTEQKVTATVQESPGKGITITQAKNANLSSRLINKTVQQVIPKDILCSSKIAIDIQTDIPAGYGLKSSSAISSAVALACTKLFKLKLDDQKILLAGVDASIQTKVSITGAYDDACACYYGGFNVTDNLQKKIIRQEKGPRNVISVIFLPSARKRGNLKKLKILDAMFDKAWNMARNSDYWNAMTLNGLATSSILNSDPKIITELLEKGAIAASVSGNGPAIVAITKQEHLVDIKKVFLQRQGRIIITKINNKKARVHQI